MKVLAVGRSGVDRFPACLEVLLMGWDAGRAHPTLPPLHGVVLGCRWHLCPPLGD